MASKAISGPKDINSKTLIFEPHIIEIQEFIPYI